MGMVAKRGVALETSISWFADAENTTIFVEKRGPL